MMSRLMNSLWKILAAAAPFLAKWLAEKLLSQGSPRAIAIVIIGSASFVVGAIVMWLVWRRPSPYRPGHPGWAKWTVTVIAVLTMGYFGWLGAPVIARWGYAVLVLNLWAPPKIELVADPVRLGPGQTLRLSVFVNEKKADPDQTICEWQVEKVDRVDFYLGSACETKYLLEQQLVKRGQPPKPLRITTNVYRRGESLKLWGTASTTVELVYAPIVQIYADRSTVFAGQTTNLEARVDGELPQTGYNCHWTLDGTFVHVGCRWSYIGTISDRDDKSRKSVSVGVRVVEGRREIGQTEVGITVDRGERFYTMFLVDTSKRMAEAWAATVKSLAQQLDSIDRNGGNAALITFGVSSPGTRRCDDPRHVFGFVPRDFPRAIESVNGLGVTGDKASLIQALKEGIAALAAQRRATGTPRLSLVTITGGLDTCYEADVPKVLAVLRDGVRAGNLNEMWLNFRLLTMMVAVTFSADGSQVWAEWEKASRGPDDREVLVFATNPQLLNDILGFTTALDSSNYDRRKVGCEGLLFIIRTQNQSAGERNMTEFCRKLLEPR